jgi:hypothetical protein
VKKYLLSTEEAAKFMHAEKNIAIDIGETEEQVVAKLGEPLKTIRVGSEKTR